MEHAFKMGTIMTNNIFFVEDVLYYELLKNTAYVSQHPGNIVVNKLVQSSVYMAWNYVKGGKREVDYDTFRTQLSLFKYFKEHHEGYMDALWGELLDYDLCDLAIRSEHMF